MPAATGLQPLLAGQAPTPARPGGMRCCLPGLAFVPALLVSWSSAAFIVSYVIAVLEGHVQPLVPYISDTGTKPPESGIFGFMINISALLGAVTMYIRYLIVEKQKESSDFVGSLFNLITLCIGLLGCIGMGIVATFQELAVPSVHDGGALMAFGAGVVYITLQSIISYKSYPQWSSRCICYIRISISVVSCIAVIPMIAFASRISITKIDWIPGEKGYVYHFVSAICEWTVAFGFVFYFLTFIRDFQRVTLRISTEMHEDF
ncbi:DNA damage-regulated autophagy modulator protein 1 [Alligator mississippiensis]|uniref:DNA damage-regulated autophagy modulator protein 1 n=1 Tax=Alligator mississippiensis TaxID=8496 RepID=UPI002877B251|nr:DNA damage-regulated autophagy modulator protein 1 [Alligator mississippiensis]